jgi:hypothetical protein
MNPGVAEQPVYAYQDTVRIPPDPVVPGPLVAAEDITPSDKLVITPGS